MTVKLNSEEKVALAFLATIGATAVDSGVTEDKRKQFENKFGTRITPRVVASVVKKMADLLSGSETIIID